MISAIPANIRKNKRIDIRADDRLLKALDDLKTLHPGKKKSRLIYDAVLEKLARDSR